MATIEVHPAAAIFPMLSDGELTEMARSITAFGLREKIGVIPSEIEGVTLVLDGRNRLEALRRLGVTDEQIIDNFTSPIDLQTMGASPSEYVLMANIERRNLNAKQRRGLAGKLAVMLEEQQAEKPKEEKVDTLSRAAELTGVSRRTAANAKQEVLAMAKSESEVEGTKPKRKTSSKKKAGPKRPPANIIVVLGEMAEDTNTYGHNFSLDEMQGIVNKTQILLDFAESKLGSIAEKAAKEAERIAGEAAKIAHATKKARAKN
jgi:hypothetical protein